ncbi:MAG: MoxR family ATPase [Pseudomonadales bacterium]|jgi:MoxR-like ATPase|tara:strand:- start:10330 stop:11292 length:963 start_codon:yes stop_codon:yes gene_type:complete
MSTSELTTNFENIRTNIARLQANVAMVMRGNQKPIEWLLTAFFTGGHVLLEDVPGTGKTTLAKSLAGSIAADFKRVQFTPDLLPTDILGVSIFNQNTQDFRFRKGPIFTQILLADEINRASPRTQSALLEAMGENQVSVEGDRFALDDLFFVIATQNPIEFHGTYPLPEAQMDRFAMRFSLGYVSEAEELEILSSQAVSHPIDVLQPCLSLDEVRAIKTAAINIRITDELQRYIVRLVSATRHHPDIQMGASPRATIALMKSAQALALIRGIEFVTPDIIQELALPIIAHRLALNSDSTFSGSSAMNLLQTIIENTAVPV